MSPFNMKKNMTKNISAPLKYSIQFDRMKQHIFDLTLEIPKHSQETLTLSLPSWIPGSYMIREFAKNIVELAAYQQSSKLSIKRIDKQTWQLESHGQPCTVHYQVYAFDDSVRTAYLDQQRAFFNGTSIFLCVDELQHSRHNVTLVPTQDTQSWYVGTGLSREKGTKKYQFGDYWGVDYDSLIDCPFEIGNFTPLEFDVAGVTHHLILNGQHYADSARVIGDLQKLCQHHISLFEKNTGGKPPFSEYWFLTNILPNGFGGLEHKNSTALLCSTFDFPNKNQPKKMTEGYQRFLSLASHEYFHSWNVCRIKPMEFVPYTLNTENYTEQLWAFEGITSYYDDFSLYRTGIISFEDYLQQKSRTISRVNRGKGQYKQSLRESSFYAWTKFYHQGPDGVNNIVSYYTKGAMLALWLDLTIRSKTDGKHSLDDVMRGLWQHYLVAGDNYSGTLGSDIIELTNRLIGDSISDEFEQLLNSPSPIELTSLLIEFGVSSKTKAAKLTAPLSPSDTPSEGFIGFQFKHLTTGIEVTQVLENSPAEVAGLSVKDQLIAIDKLVITRSNLEDLLNNLRVDQDYSIDYVRNGQLCCSKLTPQTSQCELVELKLTDDTRAKKWQTIT